MTATLPPVSIPLQAAHEGLHIVVGLASNNAPDGDSPNWQWASNSPQPNSGSPVIQTVRVDTGSCGIILPIGTFFESGEFSVLHCHANGDVSITPTGNLLPGVETSWEPATVNYQPSGNNIFGYSFTVAQLGIGDENGPLVVASNVRVIGAVNRQTCMLGVGFSRPMMADNLFLAPLTSTSDTPASLAPSYYLDATTVMLGGSPPAVEDSITWQDVKCRRQGTAGTYQDWSWAHPLGSVQLGTNYFAKVSILPDSGTGAMLVNYFGADFPPADSPSPLDNTNMAVCFEPNATFPFSSDLSYNFDILPTPTDETLAALMMPELTPAAPDYVAGNGSKSMPTGIYVYSDIGNMPFVNTGCHVMQQFGMIFDASASRFGMLALPTS